MDEQPLTPPRIYLIRMAVFLILAGFVAFILYRQIIDAFMANPGLNGLIIGVMLIGIVLAIRQVMRLFPEIRWVNTFRQAEEGVLPPNPPILLAPMASFISGRSAQSTLSVAATRSLLDSVGARLDESREIVRYLAGLLVFLGLLGTFWGLIDTVGSVGRIISSAADRAGLGGALRRAEELARRPAAGHGPVLLGLAVRPRRLARPRLPRPPGRPGAKPLLHGTRGLARHVHHGHAGADLPTRLGTSQRSRGRAPPAHRGGE